MMTTYRGVAGGEIMACRRGAPARAAASRASNELRASRTPNDLRRDKAEAAENTPTGSGQAADTEFREKRGGKKPRSTVKSDCATEFAAIGGGVVRYT